MATKKTNEIPTDTETTASAPANYFDELARINVSDRTETKNGLTYLSWAWAWYELKKRHPDATYTVYENAQGWNYHTDGQTAWVKTGVTVNGIEHIEYLPVMDYKNRSIPLASITSFDVNKAIQRSITKAIGRHGIGLSLYAGEDLITEDDANTPPKAQKRPENASKASGNKTTLDDHDAAVSAFHALNKYIGEHNLDGNEIAARFHLGANSTAADFNAALEYCKEGAR